jgi:hypothetical protein
VAHGIVADAAAALANPKFVGASVVVLPRDPVVSQDPAAKARQPFGHDPASLPLQPIRRVLDLGLVQRAERPLLLRFSQLWISPVPPSVS